MSSPFFAAKLQVKCEAVTDTGNGNDKVKLQGGHSKEDPELLNSDLSDIYPSVSLGMLFPQEYKGPKPEAGKHYLIEMIEIDEPANDQSDDLEPDDAA